jgi:dUTPase
MVLQEVPVASFYQVDKVDELETKRGEGGFGSSGK